MVNVITDLLFIATQINVHKVTSRYHKKAFKNQTNVNSVSEVIGLKSTHTHTHEREREREGRDTETGRSTPRKDC